MEKRLYDVSAVRRGELTRSLVDAFGHEADVVFAYLHGSFASGAPFHDVDVAVWLGGPPAGQAGRVLDLADRLSRRLGYPVDVRALNEAPVPFQFRALQGTLLASRDDTRLADLIERAGRLYLDIAPLLGLATREAFAR